MDMFLIGSEDSLRIAFAPIKTVYETYFLIGFHLILLVRMTCSNLPLHKHLNAPEHKFLQD